MNRFIPKWTPATIPLLVMAAVGGANAQDSTTKTSDGPQAYLDSSGRLCSPLRLECEAMGHVTDAGVRTAVGVQAWILIARDGTWTGIGAVGLGVSNTGAVEIAQRKSGQLNQAELAEIAGVLSENDFTKLRNYSGGRRDRAEDAAAIGYRVTIFFGSTRRSYVLKEIARGASGDAVTGRTNQRPAKEMTERYQDICLRLLAIPGQR